MSDPMQEIRESFFVECEELLESLQEGLQQMDDGEADSETINVVFRAVHSIKGGAGAFGLDQLVAFAHAFETAMDEVRAGRLTPDAKAIALFFLCGDTLLDLVRVSRDNGTLDEAVLEPILAELIDLTGGVDASEEEVSDFQPMGVALDLGDFGDFGDFGEAPVLDDVSSLKRYKIVFKPEAELYSSGNEPAFLLRALGELGTMITEVTFVSEPDFADYTVNDALLKFTIHLETEAETAVIEEIFDFVEGLCLLRVTSQQQAMPDPAPMPAGPVDLPPLDLPALDLPPLDLPEAAMEEDEDTAGNEPAEVDAPAAPRLNAPELQLVASTDPAAPAAREKAASPSATVRVDLDRIDRLVNLVGELVINQAMLSQSVAAAGISSDTEVSTGLEEFLQLTRDIQDSVMMIRAQPVKSLFQRMARIVRESSADVGKKVRLKTDGEGTEIDKTVIERLADPLTHMIRNAVDHGLEKPDTRTAAGKPAEGVVTLSAAHKSGRVVIEVSDDGAGINRSKVREIAIGKGLIQPDHQLTDTEIDNLLFLPGFSTASEISNLSGRGVGMDVVKSSISALGGRITITSKPGIGTSFSISLPLTLAVLDGMVVRVGKETVVVPLNAIAETLTLSADDIKGLGPSTQVVRVRDTFVPLLDLATELGYAPPRDDYVGAIVLLITQEDGSRAALVVDAIEDQRQVVIKGLQESYGRIRGVAAATILGDGQIALILDPVDLVSNASGTSKARAQLQAIG